MAFSLRNAAVPVWGSVLPLWREAAWRRQLNAGRGCILTARSPMLLPYRCAQRMGAKRYDRAVLRGVLLFRLRSELIPCLQITLCRSIRQFPPFLLSQNPLSATQEVLYAVGVVTTRLKPQSGRISALAARRGAYERVLMNLKQ